MTARQLLLAIGQFNKPGTDKNPSTGQTITAKLRRRVADWKQMTSRPDFKANDGMNPAYHCPGSLK